LIQNLRKITLLSIVAFSFISTNVVLASNQTSPCEEEKNEFPLFRNSVQIIHPNLDIDDEKIKGLSRVLKGNQSLTNLQLQFNKIGDEGFVALASALKTMSTLTYLDIRGNNLSDKGVVALNDALKNHPNLKTVYMDIDKITPCGFKDIE
jgi:Leucine-rich repeat (LRR) protein